MNQSDESTRRTVAVHLNPTPAAPGDARRFVVDVLDHHPALEDVKLVVSELVTNAVLHGGREAGHITLSIVADDVDNSVRIDVNQPDHPGFDADDAAHGHMETTGRGLMIVDAVAKDWGFDRSSGSVWAVLV